MKEKQYGYLMYDEKEQQVTVSFPDREVVDDLSKYFNTDMLFDLPKRTDLDGVDETIIAKPKEKPFYFYLSLSNLFTHTGVMIDWRETIWNRKPLL